MELINFLEKSRSPFTATKETAEILLSKGYKELKESEGIVVEKGGKYFIRRNDTSIIALNIGSRLEKPSLHLAASHTDCPNFKVKPNALIKKDSGVQLNVEGYGGPIFYTWLDRPLSLSGRVMVRENGKIVSKIYQDEKPFCIIPSVAIHMNRDVNNGYKFNPQVDMLPFVTYDKDFGFEGYLAENIGVAAEDVLSFDLYIYPIEKGTVWGKEGEFFTCQHIDNLDCAYASLMGFVDTFNENNINVYASFDNEEVGSSSRQGANSDFLNLVLHRVCDSLDLDFARLSANGMQLSCDNAHSVHPNHPEFADVGNRPVMNGGIVIKFNANQSYTSDSLSCALFKDMCAEEEIPCQYFANRSDMRGGGTLGNISESHVSLISVDIGLAQLAMHSVSETAGVKDVEYLINASKAFYSRHLVIDGNSYKLEK